jgi:hypothetical protein
MKNVKKKNASPAITPETRKPRNQNPILSWTSDVNQDPFSAAARQEVEK